MKRIALLTVLLASSSTWAEPPADSDAATRLVQTKLLQPLATRDAQRSRFSRAAPAPMARRLRILDEQPQRDEKGATFVRYAIDTRHGFSAVPDEKGWRQAAEVGCVYVEQKEVFVKRADRHFPVEIALGKRPDAAPPHVCQPAAAVAAAAR